MMRTNDLIELKEISPNHWYAKYQGNYGIYTVKIAFNQDDEISSYSCSCPSDYSPCKHIRIVQDAITELIDNGYHSIELQDKTLSIEKLLENVSLKELRDFVVRQAKYNSDLNNAVKLEFAHSNNDENINPYSVIIKDILDEIHFDPDNYNGEYIETDDLLRWFEKARAYAAEQNYHETVLICKACIEEFAEWRSNEKSDISDYINPSYETEPFEILEDVVKNSDIDFRALYDYCLTEMNKPKYLGAEIFDLFNDLLMILAGKTNSQEFIALQEQLLVRFNDKTSREAEKILQREISFYTATQQPEKANNIIEQNIQIENFRYQAVERRIAEQRYGDAKQLIEDFIMEHREIGRDYSTRWNELLLEIAMQENNVSDIRTIAFSFIQRTYIKKYYDIYRATFTSDEWNEALENLLQHYQKNSRDSHYNHKFDNFSTAVAEVLLAEGATERLMLYIEQNPSLERMETYYTIFVNQYPEKTLKLFQITIDDYVAKNVGRHHYEHVAELLKQIGKIKNGRKTVAAMVANYRAKYKPRRVMLEILNEL